MSAVTFNDECWPLVLSVFPDRAMTDEEWLEYLQGVERHRARGRLILIIDSPGSKHLPNAKQRALIASNAPADAGQIGTTFVVLRSHAVRGAAKAISWLSRREYPIVYCATLEQAVDGAAAHARQVGMELANDPRALLRQRAAG